MGLLDELLAQVASGVAPEQDVDRAYDEVARSVPQDSLADGLKYAFNSDRTPPFEQMLGALFGQSNPDQKAALINQILATVGPAIVAQVLSRLGSAAPASSVSNAASAAASAVGSEEPMTPQQARDIPLEAIEVLAHEAAQKDPSIVDLAAGFFAQHPTLVKTLGAGALAILMSRISAARRQPS